MPRNRYGQLISFAVVINGGDYDFSGRRDRYRVTRRYRTCKAIAGFFGHPELAKQLKKLNNVRSIDHKMKVGRVIKLTKAMRPEATFNVLAGETAPIITAGYPNIEVIDRANRTGISVFKGYSPLVMQVPIRFEAMETVGFIQWWQADGAKVEKDIKELERMAGRGRFKGAAIGRPSIIQVSTTGEGGVIKPLIPDNYQPNGSGDVYAPIWWISGIDWDPDPLRNNDGQRIRQLATVSLTQYVQPKPLSAAQRKRLRPAPAHAGSGGRALGLGGDILYVGDSLGQGTFNPGGLGRHIARHIDKDNVQGRSGDATLAKLKSMLKPKHHTVVFDAGTNDLPYPGDDLALLSRVADAVNNRKLVICTIANTNAETQGMNQGRRNFAKQREKVQIYDWAASVNKRNLDLPGGFHPTTSGYQVRAREIAKTIAGGV